jgi:hypothetical protein
MPRPASRLVSLLTFDRPWVSTNYRGLGYPFASYIEHILSIVSLTHISSIDCMKSESASQIVSMQWPDIVLTGWVQVILGKWSP